MSERELRLFRALANYVRDLHAEIRAIREDQKADKRERDANPNRPVLVKFDSGPNVPVAIREYYEAENRERNTPWSRGKTIVEVIGIAAAIFVAIFTGCTLREVQKQTVIAQQQSRPWIKVIDVALNNKDSLMFDWTRLPLNPGDMFSLFAPVRPNPISRFALRADFKLRNIGKSVAQDVALFPELFAVTPNAAPGPGPIVFNALDAVAREQARFCAESERHGQPPQYTRSALFPEDEYTFSVTSNGWVYRDDISKLDGADYVDIVLVGCITYRNPPGSETRVVYNITGMTSRMVKFREDLPAEKIRSIRDEHHEYAQ